MRVPAATQRGLPMGRRGRVRPVAIAIALGLAGCIQAPVRRIGAPPSNPSLVEACDRLRAEHNRMQVAGAILSAMGGGAALAADLPTVPEKIAVGGSALTLAITGATLVVVAGLEANQLSQGHCSEVAP